MAAVVWARNINEYRKMTGHSWQLSLAYKE